MVVLVAMGAVGGDAGHGGRPGGWAGRQRAPSWFRVPGLCGCFGQHPARPALLLVLSLPLALA
jgi:hypothetical protein